MQQLTIEGMHCNACVRRVQMTLDKVEGLQVKQVAIGSAEVEAVDGSGEGPLAAALAALEKAGYPAKLASR